MTKRALITGVSGQDGSYLAEHLLALGYEVFGMIRREPSSCRWLDKVRDRMEFVYGNLRDSETVSAALHRSWPDEIYNLGGQVFVPVSWDHPVQTLDVNVGGLVRILKWVEERKNDTRVYQASSSEMYGNSGGGVNGCCDEGSDFSPISPYGISKYAAHQMVAIYRARGLFVVGGILFNHESPRRGREMVTRKIAHAAAHWALGRDYELEIGNLQARRDWGFAGDYVTAMVKMLTAARPVDYVVGTGESHSVEDFLNTSCLVAGLPADAWRQRAKISDRLTRKNDIHYLRGNARRIRDDLGWRPSLDFQGLVGLMVNAEIERLQRQEAASGS